MRAKRIFERIQDGILYAKKFQLYSSLTGSSERLKQRSYERYFNKIKSRGGILYYEGSLPVKVEGATLAEKCQFFFEKYIKDHYDEISERGQPYGIHFGDNLHRILSIDTDLEDVRYDDGGKEEGNHIIKQVRFDVVGSLGEFSDGFNIGNLSYSNVLRVERGFVRANEPGRIYSVEEIVKQIRRRLPKERHEPYSKPMIDILNKLGKEGFPHLKEGDTTHLVNVDEMKDAFQELVFEQLRNFDAVLSIYYEADIFNSGSFSRKFMKEITGGRKIPLQRVNLSFPVFNPICNPYNKSSLHDPHKEGTPDRWDLFCPPVNFKRAEELYEHFTGEKVPSTWHIFSLHKE